MGYPLVGYPNGWSIPALWGYTHWMSDYIPGYQFPSGAHELWSLIPQAYAVYETRVREEASALGLSAAAAWTLTQLQPDSPISQKELAARLHCDPSTVVDATDKLEERGLVVRQSHHKDRRVNILVVTGKGRKARKQFIDRLVAPPEPLRQLSGKQQALLCRVLGEIVSDEGLN